MTAPRLGMFKRLHLGTVRLAARVKGSIDGTERLPRPVISVGNLAFGGTGKTPLTDWLARTLSREGYLVCILSRGYGGTRTEEPLLVSDLWKLHAGAVQAGDEASLLARRLPGIPVVVGSDRAAAGRFAIEKFPVHLFLLDDGFQHRRLERDVDIVLLDALDPWSSLREDPRSLARAHCVIATRAQRAGKAALDRLREQVKDLAPEAVFLTARTTSAGFRRLSADRSDLPPLEASRVLAFCGLARPEPFFEDLASAGLDVVGCRSFGDHWPYAKSDLQHLLSEAEERGASALVTTEKDAVRLPLPRSHEFPPVYALRHRVALDDVSGLASVLQRLLPEPRITSRS